MSKKVALVTGGNRGIGQEIVRQLALQGFSVILTARFAVKGKVVTEMLRSEDLDVTFVQLDVTDERSIDVAYESIRDQFGKIDVLVNNAGILVDGTDNILQIPTSKLFLTLQTNALGSLMVTRKMIQLMETGGRVVMISSGGGAICEGISEWAPIYCVSKTALNAITLQLVNPLKEKGISINAVCPGWVRTDMGGKSADRSVEKGAETPVWLATDAPRELSGKFLRDKKEIKW